MKLIIALLLFSNVLFSQKYELGKVSVKELEEKQHPLDTAAVAAILYNKVETSFTYSESRGFMAKHEFEIRIKIYKKEGLKYANYEIPYRINYTNLNSDALDISSANTYNLKNGKIERTKLTKEGDLLDKVNDYYKIRTLSFPEVSVGSVIEFKYVLKSENLLTFPDFIIQREIPVNYSEYVTKIPVTYVYKPIVKGFLNIKNDSKLNNTSISFTNSQTKRTDNLTFQELISTHSAHNVPAMNEESFVDNLNNYKSSIKYELEMIQYKNSPNKSFSQTWEDLTKTLYEDEDFGKQLLEHKHLEGDLKTVTSHKNDEERMLAVFNHIKNKFTWNKKNGIYTNDGVKNAYHNNTGNVAEINFNLISMLNISGIRATPVILSTIGNGIVSYPNRTAFNYVIAMAEIGNKKYLLDATNKYSLPDILPLNVLNWTGRKISKYGDYEEIDLKPTIISRNNVVLFAKLDKEGTITGKARFQKTDYHAFEFRNKFSNINEDQYLEYLENSLNKISIENYKVDNLNQLSSPVVESFDFATENQVDIIGDKIYINPLLFFTKYKNPFNTETRDLPIYFGYPDSKKYNITIEIPEEYEVEYLPQSVNLSTGENVAFFKFNIGQNANQIQINANFDVNSMLVSQNFYSNIKEFYNQVITKQTDKIILKKK